MKPSPVQLLQSNVDKISVEVNNEFEPDVRGAAFSEGITLQVKEHFEAVPDFWDEQGAPPKPGIRDRTFMVTLGIRTDPKEKKSAPYSFEILATGIVACMPEKVNALEPDEAAKQYGLSMIYGAMREQLLMITSRMVHGPRLLPTVSFMESPRAEAAKPSIGAPTGDPLALGRSALDARD